MAQTDLGKWMITNGGNYNSETTYEQLTIVLYNDSMFLTLKTVKGITPVNDNINYSLMAQGVATTLLSGINATDTYGALGEIGATVSSQALVDYLADSVMNKLIAKTQIANDLTTQDSDKVLSALQGYNLNQSIDQLNSNTVKTIEADSSDINSQIISEWVWNLGDTPKLVVSRKKHDGTVTNMFVDLDSNASSKIIKAYYNNLTTDSDGLCSIQAKSGYTPIFAWVIYPTSSMQTYAHIQYNPYSGQFFAKTPLISSGIELNVIYVKLS